MNVPRERDDSSLAASLEALGVRVLRVPEADRPVSLEENPARLVLALVRHPQARFRDVSPATIVACSRNAQEIRSAGEQMTGEDAPRFRVLYTLAAGLQRMWSTRLRLSLPDMRPLDDPYSAGLGLPKADERHGRLCLAAMDPALVESCGGIFRTFMEEMERGQRVAAASRGHA